MTRVSTSLADYPEVLPATTEDVLEALPAEIAVPPVELEPSEVAAPVALAEPAVQVDPVTLPAPRPPRPWQLGFRGFCGWVIAKLASAWEWCFGFASLTVALALLAATPVLGFFALGYLLEAGGRIARSGRLRDGFPGVRKAARVGSIVFGTWLSLLPLRLVSSYLESAQIIDPGGAMTRVWRIGLIALTVLLVLHVAAAIARGGRLRHFLWPFTNPIWLYRRFRQGGYYAAARDGTWDFVMGLRLPYYFWLGTRGFIGAFIWLVIPISMMAIGKQFAPIGLLGGFLLALVLLYVPFLQIRFAVENRFRALFEWRMVRRHFAKAPYAFVFALFITLLFAIPLYLLKIETLPSEAAWLPSLFFIAFIFPARLLAGWAYGLAAHRPKPRHWFFRWTARMPLLPLTIIYCFIVFWTQYTSWNGVVSLYEQHAFLLPVPYLGS